ncbi:MAG: ATP-binding protein, partial [Herpetosiphon sp.]|nr:ATP-binding protein [Herpetosiphon sp.]
NQNDLIVTPLPEPIMIYGDQRRMHQVMLNLLSNAAKFTHNGTVTLSVQFNDTQEKRWIEISVQDTGIGMSSTQLEQLFQEFSQVHRKKRTTYEGTGLGLVISRKLCERMGGTIVVASNEGVGTTFTVRLPDHTMHD